MAAGSRNRCRTTREVESVAIRIPVYSAMRRREHDEGEAGDDPVQPETILTEHHFVDQQLCGHGGRE